MTPPVRPGWGPAERAWFRAAVARASHTQEECAAELQASYGVTGAVQTSVTRWISGDIKRPRCAEQLLRYCETHAPGARQAHRVSEPEGRQQAASPSDVSDQIADDITAGLVAVRQQLRRDRRRSRQLSEIVARLDAQLAESLAAVDELDRVARSHRGRTE